MKREETYSISTLLTILKDAGLPSSRTWLYTVERQNKLVCPRRPNSRRDRVFTEKQMDEIVTAFSVDGKGEWKYENNS